MIAKRLRQSNNVAGIVHLVRYITSTQGRDNRVSDVFISNCNSDTPMMAVREMLAKQLLNTRSHADKTYHLLVSFQQGEEPMAEILRKIESTLCARLGFGQHQRVAAVHRDTDHVHMHVAINKIHPKKLTIHTPYYDFDVLGKACVEIEQKLGVGKDNHDPGGKTRGERQAKDIEALTGNESLHTWIHREVFDKLQKAESWDALHAELARAGLALSLRGAGVVITSNSGHRLTGSNLHRSFSKFHLEKRLGKFQPKPDWCVNIRPEKEYLRSPQAAPGDPLREEYEKLREARNEAKEQRLAAIALEHTRKKEVILAENVADRARARNTVIGRFPKRRLYASIHGKYRSQLELLMAETKRARKAVYSEFPSQSWTEWLQAQAIAGRTEAVEALRRRAFALAKKNGAALRGEKQGEPTLIPDQRIRGVTKLGTVIYDLGTDAVRDDGESFRVSAGASAETDIMALKLAQRRFGNVIFADGDRAFRERMLKAAVEGKVFVKFGDPAMERRRNELLRIRYGERREQEDNMRQWPENGHGVVQRSVPGDGHAAGERPENGHGRDEESTRGASPSR